jgi:MFS family permease
MLLIGTVTQAISGILTGLASGISFIYVGRILAEVRLTTSMQVLINRWFIKKRGRAQGIVATGMPIGTFALIPLSQYLILTWGWRPTLFFWSGVIFIISLTLVDREDRPEDKGIGPDGEILDTASRFQPPEARIARVRAEGNTFEAIRPEHSGSSPEPTLFRNWLCFMMTHTVIFATDVGYSEMIGATFLSIQGIFNLAGSCSLDISTT